MLIREAKVEDAAVICSISSKDLGYEGKEFFIKDELKYLQSNTIHRTGFNTSTAGYTFFRTDA